MTLLQVENVDKAYPGVDGGAGPVVLRGVSMTVDAGESVAIVGPSGSGKSTLLNIIGALDRPTKGTVRIDGNDLATLDDRQLAELRNRRIGFVFQAHHLLPQLTTIENVLVPVLAQRSAEPGDAGHARQLLDRVGLGDRINHRPGQLSGGERQRVAVVRALINRPALLLADEPTGALDRDNAEHLVQLLVELNREQNTALIMVSHAGGLAHQMRRVCELRDGELHDTGG